MAAAQAVLYLGVRQAHLVERLDHRLGRAAGVHLQRRVGSMQAIEPWATGRGYAQPMQAVRHCPLQSQHKASNDATASFVAAWWAGATAGS